MQGFTATTKRPSARRDADGAAFARYYDMDVADEREDINMYLALASASDGPILELACGSGRVCVPLAAAGHRVMGVDRDPHMLERARGAWQSLSAENAAAPTGKLDLVCGDITGIRLVRQFDLVVLAFNSMLLLAGPGERSATLATMRNHLSLDGRAVLDVWQPSPEDLELYDGRVIGGWTKRDPETGDLVSKSTVATYDSVRRRGTIRTIYEIQPRTGSRRRLERIDEISFVSRDELFEEMQTAELEVQSVDEPSPGHLFVTAALSVHPFHTSRTN